MNLVEEFKKEVYEPLGKILEEEGDKGFITKGPELVKKFYEKYPKECCCLDTKHAEKGYTRKKVVCENGRHAVRCMEWCPEASSPIHEHGGRPCFDIVLEGEIEIVDYLPKKKENSTFDLKEVKRYVVGVGEFVIVDPTDGNGEVHEVVNHKERSKSLHFYPTDHRRLGMYKKVEGSGYEHIVSDVPDD